MPPQPFIRVKKLASRPTGHADWHAPPWGAISPQPLRHHMGAKPDHFPATAVKIAYDETAIYVMFRVVDRYVRAVAGKHQGRVWEDSCVEFFFTPGTDTAAGYFNVEMNCGGTMLFHYNTAPRSGTIEIPANDCAAIPRAHTLPRIVDPEIRDAVTWIVDYAIPITILKRYCTVSQPEPAVVWRANFYKCADHTSHPHWLTWSPVDHPRPDFHRPEAFGFLEFQ